MTITPSTVYVTGYHTANDGAFGSHFYRLATDTGQVDNSGTIIRAVNGVYELQYSGAVNVKWFGTDSTAGVDNSTIIQTVLNSGIAKEYIISEVYYGKEITVTNNTIQKIYGGGRLKLLDGANTFLINFHGTNELKISTIIIDGNKFNQTGGTQANRGQRIVCNIVDATTVGTQFDTCLFIDGYYGAMLNNSGIRTSIDRSFFYNGGIVGESGSCDAIFNGPDADATVITNSYMINCTDYGIALDTSNVVVENNTITNCFAGIGSLTRGTQVNHKITKNTIIECIRPFDYFNTADVSATVNDYFKDISIYSNTIYSTVCVSASISFSGNNTLYRLFEDISIYGNTIYTPNANNQSAIFLSSATSSRSSRAKVYNNTIIGDYVTASARYAINIANVDAVELYGNTLSGVDLGVSLTNSSGLCYGNTFDNLRDCYAAIDNSSFVIREDFIDIARRAMMIYNGTALKFTGSFENVDTGILIYDGAGALPVTTSELDIVIRGTKTNTIQIDGTLSHQVNFIREPIQITPFVSNVIQSCWNLQQVPTTGTWTRGNKSWNYLPSIGSPKGWVCTVSGSSGGTWVADAVL